MSKSAPTLTLSAAALALNHAETCMAELASRRATQVTHLKKTLTEVAALDPAEIGVRVLDNIAATGWHRDAFDYALSGWDKAPTVEDFKARYEGICRDLIAQATGSNIADRHFPRAYWNTLAEVHRRMERAMERIAAAEAQAAQTAE